MKHELCLGHIPLKGNVAVTYCRHIFHVACVNDLLAYDFAERIGKNSNSKKTRPNCRLCRKPVSPR